MEIAAHGGARAHVERGERFVKQEYARRGRQRAHQGNSLRLAAGQRLGTNGREFGETHALEPVVGGGERARFRRAACTQTERNVLDNCHVFEQHVVLKHEPDRATFGLNERRNRRVVDRVRVDHDSPSVDCGETSEATQQRALARTVRTEQRQHLAGPHLDVDAQVERSAAQLHVGAQAHSCTLVDSLPARMNQRSRSATSTANEIAIMTNANTIACSGLVSRARYTANGIVWVVPGKLPAKVMVAPNSPSARAHASAEPAASAGPIAGKVTRRNVYQREAPSVRAASSNEVSSWRKAASTVTTKNGMATNVCAMTTPAVVNGRRRSNQ